MMRIVHTGTPVQKLSGQASTTLYKVIALLIAEHPDEVKTLLADYSICVKDDSEKELTEKLFNAISECHTEFNRDLSKLIFSNCLDSSYDHFNIKSLFSKDKESSDNEKASGGSGLLGGIGSAIGGLSGALGDVIKGKQAKDQATSQTLQQVYAYKAQLASNEQSKIKTKKALLVSLFVILGIVLIAIIYQNRQKNGN
jgi:hypothetical protein